MMESVQTEKTLVDYDLQIGREASHDLSHKLKIQIEDVSFWYGEKKALDNVSLDVFNQEVTAFIGASGCGKTTLLRCLNRTNEIIPDTHMEGQILLDGEDIFAKHVEASLLRRRFGWVAQKPNPFPWSVYRNVAYGPKLHGLVWSRKETDERVQKCLELAGLWDEVKDRLREPGTELSGGQQQRLCVARAISTNPDIILMDEPASALDPNATAKLEELIEQLREKYCIIIITHNLQQAARISQRTAFFHLGRLLETGDTMDLFTNPKNELCEAYISGRFG